MKVPILNLTRQYAKLANEIEPAVCEQMAGGMYIGGPAVETFEKAFANHIGVRHAIAVNSGTDALVIAMKALGIGEGDEVITTPFTFFATAETIAMVGAVPVFADVEEDTYNIDPDSIEAKITPRTKAILPVHIFGQPAEMGRIREIAGKHGLKVIEDACQAVGAEYAGQKVGGIGEMGCFSFFPTKNLGGFGDGGMITTNSDQLAVVCRAFREHGGGQNGAKARSVLTGMPDELAGGKTGDALYNPYKYYNYLIAYNSRLDAIQARVLLIKLKHLDEFNARRAEIAARYNEAFASVEGIQIPAIRPGVKTVWHQYAFRCENKDGMGEHLASLGIGSAAFYPVPLHLQKAFEGRGYQTGDLPTVEKITKQTVCLPIFPELSESEIDAVIDGVKSFFS